MRRFSQRNSLVTLSDINITPLLDLAFVLLIIFVITTPMLEQTIKLDLPGGGKPDKKITKDDVRLLEVQPDPQGGGYLLGGNRLTLNQIEAELVRDHRANPNLVVRIRVSKKENWERMFAAIDRCERNGIRINLAGVAPK